MEHLTFRLNTSDNRVTELNPDAGEYIPVNKCIGLVISNSEILNRISVGDELLMVEYSGSVKTTVQSEPYCKEIEGDMIITNDTAQNFAEDVIVNMYTGTAIGTNSEGIAYFSVEDDISSILCGNTVVNEEIINGDIRKYHYVSYFINKSYYIVQFGLSSNDDYIGMNSEANVNEIFAESKENLVPPIVDLEKIKFSPVYFGDNGYEKVNKLVFRFNFLHRDCWTMDGNNYVRTDSWAIDNNGWYNGGNGYSGNTLTSIASSSSAGTSTPLGYISFTDGDVRFQKNKLSKSFARFSYYSTNDLINNSLLNFSTSFLDSGELFGKYVKMERDGTYIKGFFEDQEMYQYIHTMSNSGDTIDCTICITDEYDEKKSGEGFNIYLFSDDFKNTTENNPGTIYMKVEFNHAGYGKTLQMMRPEDNEPLTSVGEYSEAVFIPINVFYEPLSQRFVYTFDKKRVDYKDGVIYIDLYEATITGQAQGKNLC